MALGATAGNIESLVLRKGIGIATVGVVTGIGAALLTNRVLTTLLFDVSPTDGSTLASVGAFLVLIGAVASLVPARQSGRIDPVIALRSEA